jgi:hypothetical protein
MKRTKASPSNGELIKRLCDMDESINIEFKRASGKMVHKALETIVARLPGASKEALQKQGIPPCCRTVSRTG